MTRPLTAHQLDVIRSYDQLGTIAAVADFRGTTVANVNNTLGIIRDKLGVKTSKEAAEIVRQGGHRALQASSAEQRAEVAP